MFTLQGAHSYFTPRPWICVTSRHRSEIASRGAGPAFWWGRDTLHLPPYTLHLTPCTLPLAPYILHLAPCTLHLAPCTLHVVSYTLHLAPYILHLKLESPKTLKP